MAIHPKLEGLDFWIREQERLGEVLDNLAGHLAKALGVERPGDKGMGGQGDKGSSAAEVEREKDG